MTRRAVTIGLLAVALIALGTPYCDLVVQGTWVGLTAFPISALFLLLVLVSVVNVVPRRVGLALSRGELIVIYCMMLVAAGIPSFGLTGLLIPYLAGPFYFATPENKWEQSLWPQLPAWLHPPPGRATTGLYEGLRPGAPLPWGEWVLPLAVWSLLALLVYGVFLALCALLRKRWVDDEKLVFPLVQLPVELTRYETPTELVPALLRNGTMWAFFAIPFFIHTLNGLHRYFPTVPGINVHMIPLDAWIKERPWSAMSPLWLRFLFSIIGLAYLLPSDLSFSLWFFFFYFLIQQVIGSALGYSMPPVQAYPVRRFVAHQMIGGIVTSFVLGLLAGRTRLVEVWQTVLGERGADEREALPYGLALRVLGACLIGIGLWGWLAGGGLAQTLVLFGIYFALQVVGTRLVCEGGMLYVQHPFRAINFMLAAMGTDGLGRHRLGILALFDHLWMLDNRSPLMPGIMQSLRLADEERLSRRRLVAALAGAVVVAMVLSYYSYLRLMYGHGGQALNNWFTTYYTRNLYSTWTNGLIVNGEPASPVAFLTMAIGAVSLWGVTVMHHTHLWWPLHPIGYLMGASWPMINFWFPVLLGWLIKVNVLKLGGHKLYRKLLPGFLGLILAEFLSAGLWVVVDMLAGVRGHEIFSF
ncbi:MAG: hypothetical protein HPY69_17085 [Armatimonadetes bacterium]|nr:hypothetical protein [Armatimonadota bacterium]